MTTTTKQKSSNKDIMKIVSSKVVDLIKVNQTLPFHKPWNVSPSMNLMSGHRYNGINIRITSLAPSPFFLSIKDVREFGIKPKKDQEKILYPITFYKALYILDGKSISEDTYKKLGKAQQEKAKFIPILRYSNMYNLSNLDPDTMPPIIKKRVDKRTPESKYNPKIDQAEAMINKHDPAIDFGGNSAHYAPRADRIGMPERKTFDSSEAYYKTLFHEMAHWTGHKTRLNREGVTNSNKFGSHLYSVEELIAEFTASQLAYNLGLDIPIDNSVAYIQSWIKSLENDPEMLFSASKVAENAVEYLEK